MKLSQLANFIAVAELGGFRQASRDLNLSQSAISRNIKTLEQELDVALLYRNSHSVSLTPYGAALIKSAKNIEAEVRIARSEIAGIKRSEIGDVKLSASPSVAMHLLPRALLDLKKSRPHVKIQIEESVFPDNLAAIHSGDNDLAICLLPERPMDDGLAYEVLLPDTLVPAVRKNHPLCEEINLTLEDLVDKDWIVFGRRASRLDIYEQTFRTNGLEPPSSTIECTSMTCALSLVEASDFIVLIPRQMFAGRSHGWPFAPLHMKSPMQPWTIAAIMRSHERLSPVCAELLVALRLTAQNSISAAAA